MQYLSDICSWPIIDESIMCLEWIGANSIKRKFKHLRRFKV